MDDLFLTLLKKELLLNILTLRYGIISGIFLLLITSSVALRTHLYQKEVKDHQRAASLNLKNMETVERRWQSEGLGITVEKPPNPLSIFALGLENEMVRSFSLSSWFPPSTGLRKISGSSFRFFLQVDFLLVVNIVCSLLALLLVYDGICGEKEQGTLKVLLSGPLPRDLILLSKMVAGWLTLVLPLVMAFLLSSLYVLGVGKVAFSPTQNLQLFWIFVFSLLYLTFFFALGTAISAWVSKSATSLVWCLFAWVILVLAFPNLVPMLMKHFSPIPPQAKVVMEKEAIRRHVTEDLQPVWRQEMSVGGQYASISALLKELRQRMDEEIRLREAKIDRYHNSRIQNQVGLSQQGSRLSPSAGYVYAATEMAGTGVKDYLHLLASVDQVQKRYLEVRTELWERSKKEEKEKRKALKPGERLRDAYDPKAWPMLEIRPVDIARVWNHATTDLLILAIYTVLLFLLSFVGFIRYDVR